MRLRLFCREWTSGGLRRLSASAEVFRACEAKCAHLHRWHCERTRFIARTNPVYGYAPQIIRRWDRAGRSALIPETAFGGRCSICLTNTRNINLRRSIPPTASPPAIRLAQQQIKVPFAARNQNSIWVISWKNSESTRFFSPRRYSVPRR